MTTCGVDVSSQQARMVKMFLVDVCKGYYLKLLKRVCRHRLLGKKKKKTPRVGNSVYMGFPIL